MRFFFFFCNPVLRLDHWGPSFSEHYQSHSNYWVVLLHQQYTPMEFQRPSLQSWNTVALGREDSTSKLHKTKCWVISFTCGIWCLLRLLNSLWNKPLIPIQDPQNLFPFLLLPQVPLVPVPVKDLVNHWIPFILSAKGFSLFVLTRHCLRTGLYHLFPRPTLLNSLPASPSTTLRLKFFPLLTGQRTKAYTVLANKYPV